MHEYGSLGCSGDLAPLSHCALALMGEGHGPRRAGHADACRRGARRGRPDPGRAGGQGGAGADQRHRRHARHAGAGDRRPAGAAAHRRHRRRDVGRGPARPPTGSSPPSCRRSGRTPARPRSAANLVALLADSGVVATHRGPDCNRVQDAYSLRCSPQVHGAARDTSSTPRSSPSRELASAVDNPVVLDDGRVESNGNFHGAPVAYVLDFLAIVAADVASISERRTDRFLDKARNHGLPPFLADDPGVDSGHMIAQYTQAAIVSEMKRLAAPGQRRLDPLQRDAGGPRLDGLVGRPQAAPVGRRADPRGRDRGAHRRPGARPARAARAVAGHRGRGPAAALLRRRGPRPRPPPLPRDRDRRRAGRAAAPS